MYSKQLVDDMAIDKISLLILSYLKSNCPLAFRSFKLYAL